MDPAALRARFPVLATRAYLNAGTDGPVPLEGVTAAVAELEREAADGRARAHFERRQELATAMRAACAGLLGCQIDDVALTSSTSEGMATVVGGLALSEGDEILTSDTEHPGLHGPLIAAREYRGVRLRAVPLAEIAREVRPETRLVACSHVSWVTGELAPAELADLDIPVLLDGAQGLGAIPVDVRALGCAAYAAAGQKWLCGPDGTGSLYVAPEWRERIAATHPAYGALADPAAGLDTVPHADARRYGAPALSAEALAFADAALRTLAEFGWEEVHRRAAALAGVLADALRERGHDVARRDATTLVAWRAEDAETIRDRLAAEGIVIRDLPGRGLLRAAVGAWNDEGDLGRLLDALETSRTA